MVMIFKWLSLQTCHIGLTAAHTHCTHLEIDSDCAHLMRISTTFQHCEKKKKLSIVICADREDIQLCANFCSISIGLVVTDNNKNYYY